MSQPIRTSLLCIIALCCRPSAERQPSTDSSTAAPVSATNVFDPETIRRGDTIAGLVLDSVERQRTPSGEWVGRAWFSGTVSLSGQTFRHPDGADYPHPCFEADTASAVRLPRWSGDSRRAWFCFEDPSDAKARLGDAIGVRKSISVDRFTVNRNLSDAVNSARLLEVGPGTARSVECFSTPQSILARRPGSVAPGPPGLTGTIRLSAVQAGESRLLDSDGRSLGATWRPAGGGGGGGGGDSIVIVGQDDFLQIELRVERSSRGLSGTAVARSDAAFDRDSAGRRTPFHRQWPVQATRVSC